MEAEAVEELVGATVAGDAHAWARLWVAIEPPLDHILASPRFLGRLGASIDDRRNIAVAVMARLRARDYHRLRIYLAARRDNPRLRFLTWLRVVAKRVGVDYLRAHPDYLRGEQKWAELTPLTSPSQVPGERPPVTNRSTAREILHASATPEQRRAVELWANGDSFEEIGARLGVADGEKLVRAAIERLRRRFRGSAR